MFFCLFQNFREDYCRFELTLLHNLEKIESLSGCQWACEHIQDCSYFVYDTEMNVCTLNYNGTQTRKCDIVHGPKEPRFEECTNNAALIWYSLDETGYYNVMIQ